MLKIATPLTIEKVKNLKSGDKVLLSGIIYTLRDAGHKKLVEQIEKGEKLPFDIKDNIIYYAGPTPAKPGQIIGSVGPTTSYRMDSYTPILLEKGLKGMIGKGNRNEKVIESIKKNECVYFAAVGGAAALIANSVVEAEEIAYHELGTESLKRLVIKDLPLIVVIDYMGNNLYETEKIKYKM